jgi:hypothetical protein
MTGDNVVIKTNARDWTRELWAISEKGELPEFQALVAKIAEAAPWLEPDVYDAAKGVGGEEWAREFFKTLNAQPRVEQKAEVKGPGGFRRFAPGPKPEAKSDNGGDGELAKMVREARKAKAAPAVPEVAPGIREWAEVVVPSGANDLETLTHLPGVVGDCIEWIVGGARRPHRMMALGSAIGVVGTLVGRLIEGPTQSATHLFLMNLAPSAGGKGWPSKAGKLLLRGVCPRHALLGPEEWASAPGLWEFVHAHPLCICYMDEFGTELRKISTQGNNVFVSAINSTLKKLYNSWEEPTTAAKVSQEPLRIVCPAVTIVATATPQAFFEAMTPGDLESGFFNRFLILPWTMRRASEQDVPVGADNPPPALIEALKRLPRQKKPDPLEKMIDGSWPTPKRMHIGWGPGASDLYYSFSRSVDGWEVGNARRYDAGRRACENAIRLATIVAIGRFSQSVDVEDIRWAIALVERSVDAAVGGLAEYMRDYLELPDYCQAIIDAIHEAGGWCAERDLMRMFRNKTKNLSRYREAIAWLISEQRIKLEVRGSRRASPGYRLLADEEEVEG